MNYRIILSALFENQLKRLARKYPSIKKDFDLLVGKLSKDPHTGVFLGNNCYKIRLAIRSKAKGKSGGARVITYLYLKENSIYLLTIYDKSEKVNIKPKELLEIIQSLDLD